MTYSLLYRYYISSIKEMYHDVVFLHQTIVNIYIVSSGTSAISRTVRHQISF